MPVLWFERTWGLFINRNVLQQHILIRIEWMPDGAPPPPWPGGGRAILFHTRAWAWWRTDVPQNYWPAVPADGTPAAPTLIYYIWPRNVILNWGDGH